jgi:hypothetical protein
VTFPLANAKPKVHADEADGVKWLLQVLNEVLEFPY